MIRSLLTEPDSCVATGCESCFSASLHDWLPNDWIPVSILHRIAAAEHSDPASTRSFGAHALPFSRVIHRVDPVRSQFPYPISRSFRLITIFYSGCANLLRRLPAPLRTQGKLRLYRVCLWNLPRLRGCSSRRTGPGANSEMSQMRSSWWQI